MRFTLVSILSIFALAGCMPKTEQKVEQNGPYSQGANSDRPIRWAQSKLSSPLSVELSSSFNGIFAPEDMDADGDDPIVQAMKSWNEAHPDMDFFNEDPGYITNKDNVSLSSFRDSVMGIYRSNSWNYGQGSDTLAITQYFGYVRNSGNSNEYLELTHADIMLNYRDNSFSTDPQFGEYDLQSVILHELGHFIGQKHQFDWTIDSIMQPYLDDREKKRSISQYDVDSILSSYGGYVAGLNPMYAAGSGRPVDNPSEEVSGIFELRKNGRCYHWQDGKLVHVHDAHHPIKK